MKRKFISHVCCEKDKEIKKKKKKNVEDVVCSCYVNCIKEMIEAESIKRCNKCNCSFDEKVTLFFPGVMVKLMNNNDEVIKKFEDCIEINEKLYDIHDVINARNMLKCSIHRDQICNDNRVFFKEMKQLKKRSKKKTTTLIFFFIF